MPADDRDPKFERALAHHLRGDAAAACPDAETLAAYHERSLSLEEMAQWKQHISGCAACQETLALVETTEKQLAEDWEGEKIPVLAGTERRPAPPRAIAVGREEVKNALGEETSAAATAPVESSRRRRPPLLRWAVPLGAVAAGVLVWIGIHEQRALQSAKSVPVQTAQNVPTPAPEQKLGDALREAPVERDDRRAQLEEEGPRKRAETSTVESRRVIPAVPTIKLEPSAKDAELAKKEPSGFGAGVIADKTAPAPPPPPARVLQQPKAPPSTTQSVEVSAAAPSVAPEPAPATSSGAVAAGVAGGMGVADEKYAARAKKDKAVNEQQAAHDLDTSAMMMKQGANGRNVSSLNALVPAPAVILTPDNHVWWKLGSGGALELTTDGGKTWKSVDTGAGGQLTAGSAPSSKICWIAGKAGTLLLTTDRGAHWKPLNTPITEDLGGVRATDAKHAAIWDAARQRGFATNDGGVTWTQTAP